MQNKPCPFGPIRSELDKNPLYSHKAGTWKPSDDIKIDNSLYETEAFVELNHRLTEMGPPDVFFCEEWTNPPQLFACYKTAYLDPFRTLNPSPSRSVSLRSSPIYFYQHSADSGQASLSTSRASTPYSSPPLVLSESLFNSPVHNKSLLKPTDPEQPSTSGFRPINFNVPARRPTVSAQLVAPIPVVAPPQPVVLPAHVLFIEPMPVGIPSQPAFFCEPVYRRASSVSSSQSETSSDRRSNRSFAQIEPWRKTTDCINYKRNGKCPHNPCDFVHHDWERKPRPVTPNYRTKLCPNIMNTGYCKYGHNCIYIHPEF